MIMIRDRIRAILDAHPDGLTSVDVAEKLNHPLAAVKSNLGNLRNDGLARVRQFVRVGKKTYGLWGGCTPEDADGVRLFQERMRYEGSREANTLARLMGSLRYEDAAVKAMPTKRHQADPDMSITGTAAAMCAL